MVSGFRVQTVAIEGFKGFTNRKEIDFGPSRLSLGEEWQWQIEHPRGH